MGKANSSVAREKQIAQSWEKQIAQWLGKTNSSEAGKK